LQGTTETSESQSAFVRDMTRALVLSGHGSQLDLTVESVIRNYCEARLDVQRYSRHDDLPEAVRQDIVSGFTRVMEGHRIELQMLGVELEEVQPGAAIDREIHKVVKRIASPSVEQIDTVRDCLSPLVC